MTTRVLFLQPYVARYREQFYQQLSESVAPDDFEIAVAVGRLDGRRSDTAVTPVRLWNDPIGRWTKDRLRLRMGNASDADLIVIEQALRNLETWPLLSGQRFGRASVAMWGHGTPLDGGPAQVAQVVKRSMTRRARWFFAYTESGARSVIAGGFPRSRVTVVNNTFDTDALRNDLASVTEREIADFRRSHSLTPGRTALFVGGVDAAKDIDFLLRFGRAAARVDPGFVLLVGGAGRDLNLIRAEQQRGGPVRALGRIDGRTKALAMRSSDLLAVPTGVGLVAVDSLVAGLPIVTIKGRSHGPEAEYLDREHQSLWLAPGVSAEDYARAVLNLMASASMTEMRQACLRDSDRYTMADMVRRFRDGIYAWNDIHRFGLD